MRIFTDLATEHFSTNQIMKRSRKIKVWETVSELERCFHLLASLPFPTQNLNNGLPSPHYSAAHVSWRDKVRSRVQREVTPRVDAWKEPGEFAEDLRASAASEGVQAGLRAYFPNQAKGGSRGVSMHHGMLDLWAKSSL